MPTSPEIRSVIRVMEEFKEVDPEITLPSILAFLYYAENDAKGGNQNGFERWLDMSTATASRATSYWMDYKRPRVAGADMVESVPDPEDRRYKMITLKRSGSELAKRLKEAFHGKTTRL